LETPLIFISMGTKEYHAKYYAENSAKAKKHKKSYEKRNKEFITRIRKRLKCLKCNLDKWYLIEFHHLDPKTKEIGVTNLQYNAYSIERIKKEIRKCVPLCRNCHMEFHHLERQKEINTFEEYLKLNI